MGLSQIRYIVRHKILNPRWWSWKRTSLMSPNRVQVFKIDDDLLFSYPVRSEIGYALSLNMFEPFELSFFRRAIQPGHTVLDIGANAGYFTVVAAKLVGPSGRVIAFEPGRREVGLLRHNIAQNNLSNVTVVEKAVSDQVGTANLAISRDGAMNSLAQTDHPAQHITNWQPVSTTTVDEFVTEAGVERVDFVKIDVEGAEKAVFEGAWKTFLSVYKPTILFEASDLNAAGFAYSIRSFLASLRTRGLKIYAFNHLGELEAIGETDDRIGNVVYNFVALP